MKHHLLVTLLLLAGPFFSNGQDWAQLSVFKEANEKLKNSPSPSGRIVLMGNSITIGWLHHHPDFFHETPYVNRGISGQTTAQMLLRFRQDVIDLEPEAVVILAGTNDIAQNQGPVPLDEIMDNLVSMAELARANDIAVVMCSVLPAADYSWRPGLEPDRKIPELNSMIRKYCDKTDATYVDYFHAMTDGNNGLRDDLGDDGVHPNLKGYRTMGPLLEAGLQKALKND